MQGVGLNQIPNFQQDGIEQITLDQQTPVQTGKLSARRSLRYTVDTPFSPPKNNPIYIKRFEKFINEIDTDWMVKELQLLRPLDLRKVESILDIVKQTNENLGTRMIRLAQRIFSFVAKAIFAIGWLVAITSFLSLLTDPSPSLILLSILKGVGMGAIVGQLGPIIPNAIESFFKWLEVKWTQYQYFSPLVEGELAETLEILRDWYKVRDKIKDYYPQISEDLKILIDFEKISVEDHIAIKVMLHEQLDKMRLYTKALLTIKYRTESREGGKQMNDFLENRSLYSFLSQKV